MNDSFVCYRSFIESFEDLPAEQFKAIMLAVAGYALDGMVPTNLEPVLKGYFILIKPQIDANIKRRENGFKGKEHGKKGGRPKTDSEEAETEPQVNPEETPNKPQDNSNETPNVNVNANVNVNVNKELLSNDNNCQSETDTASEASVPEKKQKPVLTKADLQTVKDAWNEKAGGRGVPTLFAISETSTRYKMLKARIQEYGLSKVLEGIDRIAESDFLCHGNKNWKGATFDWFVKPNNFPKVIEGYYSDTRDRASPAVTDNPLDDPDIAGYLRRKHGIH